MVILGNNSLPRRDLRDIAERLQAAGTGLRSLAEPWADTTCSAGAAFDRRPLLPLRPELQAARR